ncbi:hypothetical protein RJ639_041232 [Escallonia herrerae]|uniref:BAHD acyltransferase n=1 Tax=Escallonia herrerae TaxID=1293975 RepID=A0AA88WFW4_9ASTE|nr:hypothetical protein RJ639_041232 [Escallonia herrerae]
MRSCIKHLTALRQVEVIISEVTTLLSLNDEASDLPLCEGKNTRNVEVEIISQENIKPSLPTPHHLRTYKLSLLDQLMPPMYNQFVFFYSNNRETEDLNNVINERSKRLKQLLSETLTRFYPFAGAVKDNLHIDCDDAGVYYVEAHVKDNLSDFLNKPDYNLNPPYYRSTRVLRRFVFDAPALVALKEEARGLGVPKPTRVEAVTALIWKCASSASEERHGSERPSLLSLGVDLRSRNVPPLPQESIGNIVFHAVAKSAGSTTLELPSLVSGLRNAIEKIKGDFLEELKGDDAFIKLRKSQMEFLEDYSNSGADYFFVSSLCNAGFHEGDFGWGKPLWSCIANASIESPTFPNQMLLMETRSGGIEAWVNLDEQDMAFFSKVQNS